jgi:hypothetical protein
MLRWITFEHLHDAPRLGIAKKDGNVYSYAESNVRITGFYTVQ